MTVYYQLLDQKHKGTIVRTLGRSQQEYVPDLGWVESGILMQYFWPESELYDHFSEISEEEALLLTT